MCSSSNATGRCQRGTLLILTTLQPSATTVKSSATTVAPGKPVHLTATVTPTTESGTVTFVDGGEPMLACQGELLSSSGVAGCDTSFTTTGTHEVTAVFTSNESLSDSTSRAISVAVADASPNPTAPPSQLANSGAVGTPFTGGPDPRWDRWLLTLLAVGLTLTVCGAALMLRTVSR